MKISVYSDSPKKFFISSHLTRIFLLYTVYHQISLGWPNMYVPAWFSQKKIISPFININSNTLRRSIMNLPHELLRIFNRVIEYFASCIILLFIFPESCILTKILARKELFGKIGKNNIWKVESWKLVKSNFERRKKPFLSFCLYKLWNNEVI